MASSLPPAPRVPPGTVREIGPLNTAVAGLIGLAAGTGPPHLFTTLARHRRLYRKWLRFAAALMPGGVLPRRDSELVILRVAHNCRCDYEWTHHRRLARRAGLTREQIDRIGCASPGAGWPPRQAALLSAVDELHEHRRLSDPVWHRLAAELTEPELIELPMLAGHYEMLAMTLNSLRVQPDRTAAPVRTIERTAKALTRAGRRLRRAAGETGETGEAGERGHGR